MSILVSQSILRSFCGRHILITLTVSLILQKGIFPTVLTNISCIAGIALTSRTAINDNTGSTILTGEAITKIWSGSGGAASGSGSWYSGLGIWRL